MQERFSKFPFLKFHIPRVRASRNRGAHFAFPNQITPLRLYPDSVGAWRPLRERERPANAGANPLNPLVP
jgi:hypothetical protein